MRRRYHRGRDLLVVSPRRARRGQEQIKRVASRFLLLDGERKSLLLGTALVSTLLVGTAMAPAPAAAQTIVISQEQIRNNNAKRTTGLEAELTFNLARYNNLEADQSITLTNDIVIDNSGDIDPVIAIRTDIYNYSVDFENLSPSDSSDVDQENVIVNAIVVVNSGGLIATDAGIVATIRNADSVLLNDGFASNFDGNNFGILDQNTGITQTNTLTNAIILNTDGDIVAGQDGIDASVHNSLLQIQNAAESFNDSFGDGAILTQIAEVEQANVLANMIEIGNGGRIVTNNSGIRAGILNDDVYLYNGCACGIGSANFGDVDILSQAAEAGQYNLLGNVIVIENDGDIVTDIAGISAAVTNIRTELKNDALVLNENNGETSSGDQSVETNQINLAANVIVIDNGGDLDPQDGMFAGIENDTIRFLNVGDPFGIIPGNVAANQGTANFATDQSANLLQVSDLVNTIAIENRGAIDAGVGITGRIHNVNVELENSFVAENLSEALSTNNLTQSVDLLQNNTVSNDITIINTGAISASRDGIQAAIENEFLFFNQAFIANVADGTIDLLDQSIGVAQVNLISSNIAIENRGEIEARGIGIVADINNRIGFFNTVTADNIPLGSAGQLRQAIDVEQLNTVASHIAIANQGTIRGGEIGIQAAIDDSNIVFTNEVCTSCAPPDTVSIVRRNRIDSSISILNTGLITAQSLFAIDAEGARTTIVNAGGGVIEGFVELTDFNDRFDNQAGAVFKARQTSDFGGGNDLFRNRGSIHTAGDPGRRETTSFVNLERFENQGLISLQDGRVGDTFEISNTSPEARDLTFVASGNSTLAIDASLGAPGSIADELIVHGNTSGKTRLIVNNTSTGPGAANAAIPVVYANGDVKSDAFFLSQPIDTGFFQYDLFFKPTGSGIFELRSIIGANAFILPQLITAAQDIWHAGSSTWFDRTADLRVLLNGGRTQTAYDPTGKYSEGISAGPSSLTPAVWVRGGGNWLDRNGSESVSAFGRDYHYNLDRDLEILDLQMGLDLGKRDLLSPGDILVFGVLGGFVNADLDYDQLARAFDFEGGQVGGYATYLRGGLFVDTLLNVHLLDLETAGNSAFPRSLDATTVGLRTDSGYRFGSFNGGAFIEPLATIAVLWSEIDGFTTGANRVSFDDEANVRGRLGLRVGTSRPIWGTTTVEPFLIGSLWGNLSGDNQATLTSSGTTFRFEDDLADVWGEVSAGVNFFNPSASTAVFAKLDVTFGDDVDGIGGKAGMRVSW